MKNLYVKLKEFFRRKKSAIAIMFVFWLVPAIVVTAISIEVGRLLFVETKLAPIRIIDYKVCNQLSNLF